MTTTSYVGQISKRDLWIAAAELGMRDATEQEVGKVCFLISACGISLEDAKARVTELRRRPDTSKTKKLFGLRVPQEWAENVKPEIADLSPSQLLRYALAYVVDDSHEAALANSKRTPGPKPRKQAAS